MPDHPDTLDDRLRDLVARAVADAPPPPGLDEEFDRRRHDGPGPDGHPPDRRWRIGGGVALAAAAAAIAVVTFAGNDDEVVRSPATEPTVMPSVAPRPTPEPTAPPSTVPATPTTVPAAAAVDPGSIVTAGPDGVVRYRDGQPEIVTDEPMVFAIAAGDGAIIVQRYAGPLPEADGRTDADTVPLVVAADGTVSELFGTADWDGAVRIHDVEIVDGRQLMLFSLRTGMISPEAADETLYVVDLDTQERTEIARVGGWEFGVGRLHLATTGLIVGESYAEANTDIVLLAVPGSPADGAEPTRAELGLSLRGDVDCTTCPTAFSVSADGATVLWLDPVDDVTSYELVTFSLADGTADRVAIDAAVPANLLDDIDAGATSVVVSFLDGGQGIPAPMVVPADRPGDPPTELGGAVATVGAGAAETPTTPDPDPPSPTTTVPAVPAGNARAIVTAGPAGVVEYRDGVPVTVTDEPMVFAIALGDGRIIAQHDQGWAGWQPGDPDGAGADATMPVVIDPDGSVVPLWPDAPPTYVTVHDVEIVDGRTLLLYTTAERVPQNLADEAGEIAYVLDLDDPAANPVEIAQVSGWEYGVDRLSLATTGLIVGEWNSGASHGVELLAVPGSPADTEGIPPASEFGLAEDGYGDCGDCPGSFAVTPDGSAIVWVDAPVDGPASIVTRQRNGDETSVEADLAPLVHAVDRSGRRTIVTFFGGGAAPAERDPPVLLIDGGLTALPGVSATFGPTAP